MDRLTGQGEVSKKQTRLDIFRFLGRIFLENRLRRIAGCKHAQHVLHGDTHVANDGLATQDGRAHGNALEELRVGCHAALTSHWAGQVF